MNESIQKMIEIYFLAFLLRLWAYGESANSTKDSNLAFALATGGRKLTGPEHGDNLKASPPAELPAQVENWKRKELRRYKEAQEKKWRRWTRAMFE